MSGEQTKPGVTYEEARKWLDGWLQDAGAYTAPPIMQQYAGWLKPILAELDRRGEEIERQLRAQAPEPQGEAICNRCRKPIPSYETSKLGKDGSHTHRACYPQPESQQPAPEPQAGHAFVECPDEWCYHDHAFRTHDRCHHFPGCPLPRSAHPVKEGR